MKDIIGKNGSTLSQEALKEAIDLVGKSRDLEAKEDFFREFFPNIHKDKVKDYEVLVSSDFFGILNSFGWITLDPYAPPRTVLAVDISLVCSFPSYKPDIVEEEEGIFINPLIGPPTIKIPEA